jgi:hypothetical protein
VQYTVFSEFYESMDVQAVEADSPTRAAEIAAQNKRDAGDYFVVPSESVLKVSVRQASSFIATTGPA